jgi:hypothetical protein
MMNNIIFFLQKRSLEGCRSGRKMAGVGGLWWRRKRYDEKVVVFKQKRVNGNSY